CTDYTSDIVRTMYPSGAELRSQWSDADQRAAIIEALEKRAINFDDLIAATGQEDADPFDLLCHIAFNAPLRTRRERAEMVRKERSDFFDRYSSEARQILNELLDKYVEQGVAQFKLPDVLRLPPISGHGNAI